MLLRVFVERKRVELLGLKALLISGLHEGAQVDPAIKAFQEYLDSMFPFLDKSSDNSLEQQKKALAEFVKYNAKIDLTDHYKKQVAGAKRLASLKALRNKRFETKPEAPPPPKKNTLH